MKVNPPTINGLPSESQQWRRWVESMMADYEKRIDLLNGEIARLSRTGRQGRPDNKSDDSGPVAAY